MTSEIQVKAVTKYYCIKHSIDKVTKHFIENKSSFSVTVSLEWNDPINKIKGQTDLIVFRDDIYKFIDVDNTFIEVFDKMRLTKFHYLQIWREIK